MKEQKIKAVKTPSGRYEYNDDNVLRYAGKTREHFNIVCARVSTQKQKTDLTNQIEKLETFCARGIKTDFVFKDIAGGIQFQKIKGRDRGPVYPALQITDLLKVSNNQ
ncbi:MAG: recombinase family protein [Desulfobacteraceae bacterium]|nr:recombinase family protein [Desulfobacteraceae bacterium]